MVELKGLAHFSVPVTNIERSRAFYTDIVGCKQLFTLPSNTMCFLDAGGESLILVERDGPINPVLDNHNGVHHSFMVESSAYPAALDHLRSNDVEITYEEDRQGGVVNGPRAYFRAPEGTVLEYIYLTSYSGSTA